MSVLIYIKRLIVLLLNKIGYDLVFSKVGRNSYTIVDTSIWEPFFLPDSNRQRYLEGQEKSQNKEYDNFPKQLRFYSLYQLAEHVLKNKIPGHFVECGVWTGHSAYILCSLMKENNFKDELYIFDSFEGGLSEKNLKDENLRYNYDETMNAYESNVFSSTEQQVRDCLEEFKFFKIYPGWIPSRFKEVQDSKFSFIHIDVDLYEPTLESLKFFYPRLSKGGIIQCDDYGLSQFPGAKKAVDEFLASEIKPTFFYKAPMGSCFIMK